MLDEAAPMLANFNGAKTLTNSTNSFNNLFEVADVSLSDEVEYSAEDEAEANEILSAVV